MFVTTVDILRYKKKKNGDRGTIVFTARAGGGRGALPDFFLFLFFPVQQTTSGIGHRVK